MSLVSNLSTRVACVAVVAGMLCATSAWAQQPPPSGQTSPSEDKAAAALKLSDEGLTFFKARDYRRASEKFLEAYALDPDPNLLFNLGRCYEALGDTAAAIDKYEQFVSKPGADSQAKLKADESLKTLRQMQNKPASSAANASPTPGETPAGSTDADSKKKSGGSLAPYAWVGLGVAVAGGTIGTVMYMLGVGDHDDVTSAPGYGQSGKVVQLTQKEAQSLVDSGDTKKTVGVVSWAIGGVGLAAAVVLFTLPRSKESGTALTVRGVPSRSGGAIRLEGTF